MKYNTTITDAGIPMLYSTINSNQYVTFDKIIILNQNSSKPISQMTTDDFSNGIKFDVNNVETNNGFFTIKSVIENNGIGMDQTAQLIGITGYLSNTNNSEQLIAVSQAVEPFVVEKFTGTTVTLVPSITIGFSNSANINVTVKSGVYVTADELNALADRCKTLENNLGTANNQISDIQNKLASAMKAKDWLANGQDFNDLQDDNSIWEFTGTNVSTFKNFPPKLLSLNNGNAWGYVKNTGQHWKKQEVIMCTGNEDNEIIAYRFFTNSWDDWRYITNDTDISTINSQIQQIENNVATKTYTDSSVGKLSDVLSAKINQLIENKAYKADLDKTLQFKNILGKSTNLDTITSSGIYYCGFNSYDGIPGLTDVLVVIHNNYYIIQIMFSHDANHSYTSNRLFTTYNNPPASWQTNATKNDVDDLNNQLTQLENGLNQKANQSDVVNARFIQHGIIGKDKKLSEYTEPGTYMIPANTEISDYPFNNGYEWGMMTVSYTGYVCSQIIVSPWRTATRYIDSNVNDWQYIANYSDIDNAFNKLQKQLDNDNPNTYMSRGTWQGSLHELIDNHQNGWWGLTGNDLAAGINGFSGWGIVSLQYDDVIGHSGNVFIEVKEHENAWRCESNLYHTWQTDWTKF